MDLKGVVADIRENWWHWLVHLAGLITTVFVAKLNANSKAKAELNSALQKGFQMSLLSNFLHDLSAAFEKVVSNAPASTQTQLSTAAAQVSQAAQAVAAALPALAEAAANTALEMIPGNSQFVGLEDEFITLLIAALEAKKSTATATAPTAPAVVLPLSSGG